MTDDEKTKIKNYIHIINLVVVAEYLLNVYLHLKNCEKCENLVKLFSYLIFL